MNREELKPIELECNMGPDVNGVVHREPWKAYDIDEVNLLLDQYDNEIKTLKESIANGDVSRITWIDECLEKDAAIAELKAEVNNLLIQNRELCQALQVMYSVEEYTELKVKNRRLRRALWLARALRARDIQRWWLSATLAPITERACRVWNNIEIKCIKKAEEYR